MTFEKVGYDGCVLESGFDPDGYFNQKRDEKPTYAGILAFLEVGWQKGPNPVLYIHTRFEGSLPEALKALERRYYDQDANGIEVHRASLDIMDRLNFVKKPL
ncbi:hypothetical protein J4558_24495 [Leptolyngbya sp. 15MV]|nr:hypothetical protein J4558_24495 [Leptolyngbya sp. 15MV]